MNAARCTCWLLPTPMGPTALADLEMHRRVRVTLVDGITAEGAIGLIFHRRGDGPPEPVLEVEDDDFVLTSPPAGVRSVEVLSSTITTRELAGLAAQWIEQPSSIPLGDEVYWDVPLGSHELLEVTIKRSRVTCAPGRDR
ncbi:hypothetical protein J2X46_001763 [Nocardioides sp. BE266]|uniref:hypothetical protein n=1 Tax=Nocardioides sp. BE266 TaxID=2817725 RepID=UPI00285CDD14|nr:hypothetical protein [Nocardioides sp. BE266]MDR7252778.1 hypothetical protein [Nocardioides sp. BE266]